MNPNPWCRWCSASRLTCTCTPIGSPPPTSRNSPPFWPGYAGRLGQEMHGSWSDSGEGSRDFCRQFVDNDCRIARYTAGPLQPSLHSHSLQVEGTVCSSRAGFPGTRTATCPQRLAAPAIERTTKPSSPWRSSQWQPTITTTGLVTSPVSGGEDSSRCRRRTSSSVTARSPR